MLPIVWSPQYEIGIAAIDRQHRVLVDILNELLEARPRPLVFQTVRRLSEYATMHFAVEEAIMEAVGYPAFDDHLAGHRRFVEQVNAVTRESAVSTIDTAVVVKFVYDWLLHHIAGSDRGYADYLRALKDPDGTFTRELIDAMKRRERGFFSRIFSRHD